MNAQEFRTLAKTVIPHFDHIMDGKFCRKCRKWKPREEFFASRLGMYGLQAWCKQCADSYYDINRLRDWSRHTIYTHRKRGFIIEITREEIEELARSTKNCAICGREFDWIRRGKVNSHTPTLDRINNEKVLSRMTVQLVCWECNRTLHEFVRFCSTVVARFPESERPAALLNHKVEM